MGSRRQSRELALKVLYQMEHGQQGASEALTHYASNFKHPRAAVAYARSLVTGIEAHRDRIDELLGRASRRWRLERMPQVDRNILRLACFEMIFSDGEIPPKVAISEALELAKRYSGQESPAFINGVLNSLMQDLPPAGAEATPVP